MCSLHTGRLIAFGVIAFVNMIIRVVPMTVKEEVMRLRNKKIMCMEAHMGLYSNENPVLHYMSPRSLVENVKMEMQY